MNSSDRNHTDPSAFQSLYKLDKLHALDNTVDMRFFVNQVERIESYNNELGDDDYGDSFESIEDSPESGSGEITNSDLRIEKTIRQEAHEVYKLYQRN
jgi:hypothetical protein